tara:strand:+ start:68 stop:676 length:609 start_codon:yes stop_codon:yes gene_type:complete
MKIKISNKQIAEDLTGKERLFPKYTTQIINLANQNSQGTRPKVVGQMSDLIQEFNGKNYNEWVDWYSRKQPNATKDATRKISRMIDNLKEAILYIDDKLIEEWVKDLVHTKTFSGLMFQESILKKIGEIEKLSYRLAEPDEESKGIDGYIGNVPVSIKPITYKAMKGLSEKIETTIIFYDKKRDGISIEYDVGVQSQISSFD